MEDNNGISNYSARVHLQREIYDSKRIRADLLLFLSEGVYAEMLEISLLSSIPSPVRVLNKIILKHEGALEKSLAKLNPSLRGHIFTLRETLWRDLSILKEKASFDSKAVRCRFRPHLVRYFSVFLHCNNSNFLLLRRHFSTLYVLRPVLPSHFLQCLLLTTNSSWAPFYIYIYIYIYINRWLHWPAALLCGTCSIAGQVGTNGWL